MLSNFARRVICRSAGLVRMNQARGMANITTESPKISGNIYLAAGLSFFLVSAGLVQANGLITWGTAPAMDAALKK